MNDLTAGETGEKTNVFAFFTSWFYVQNWKGGAPWRMCMMSLKPLVLNSLCNHWFLWRFGCCIHGYKDGIVLSLLDCSDWLFFSLLFISNKLSHLNVVELFKAQRHDTAVYSNDMPMSTPWCHRSCFATPPPPPWRYICPSQCIFEIFLSTEREIYVHKGYCMIEMAMFHDFMQPLISLKIIFQSWFF